MLLVTYLRSVVSILIALTTPIQGDSVRVEPTSGVAGNFGTWTVIYEVGASGLSRGGIVRVQLPDTWHAGERNSANRLQSTDPRADHYVSARVSRPGVRVRTEVESQSDNYLVKSARQAIDGRMERYVFVVRVTVADGALVAGDTIDVVYGDTSGGSRGMRAAIVSTRPEPILVAVVRAGGGGAEILSHPATLTATSGVAAELMMTGPSTLVVGQPSVLHVAVVDAYANPVTAFDEEVALVVVQGDVELPSAVRLGSGRGFQSVTFTPRREGIVRLEADARGGILRARSNPMRVVRESPAERIYWGDLHSHTRHSWDGVGDGVFDYAQYVSGLDFHAVTDHSRSPEGGLTRGLGPDVWTEYTEAVETHNDPGTFVTLHGYEASFPAPYGHHNVYFRGSPGPLLAPDRVTLPELWSALDAGEALTIPHHTGKFPQPIGVDDHDPELRRNFEIYSAHGLSEVYDPTHPLAFEQSDFTNASTSAPEGLFAQDAWARGLVLSTIAASDDHRAHPGQPHWGLAAVMAPALTRDSVFDALYSRRTYGTTGARILLEFYVNDEPMGGETTAQALPRLTVEAHGTDIIESIEILRYSATEAGFKTIYDLHPNTLDFEWSGTDGGFREDSVYYLRLRQRGSIRRREVMAWSSPIWVKSSP